MELLQRRAVHWICFSAWTTTPTWEPSGAAWPYTGRDADFFRAIHNIENTPFRTKFDRDLDELEGTIGIGCISDNEPQPLLIHSHLGSFAITTVGKINNEEQLIRDAFASGHIHFMEMSQGRINATELVAALINQKADLTEGLLYAQDQIKGSMSILVMTKEGIYASRDRYGRTPIVIGKKEDAFCASFESFAYINLGYEDYHELGPGEIVFFNQEGMEILSQPREEMHICSFLWVYYGYPTSTYEGINVEAMRYECGRLLARRDKTGGTDVSPDIVAGVPDSGTAHAVGYANESGVPFARPFIKYTPTWPPLLHAPEPAPAESYRPHEADSRGRADSGQAAAAHRRFHRPGHSAGRDHRISLPERGEGGTHPPGLPAPALWLPLPELLSLLLGAGSHHPADHP